MNRIFKAEIIFELPNPKLQIRGQGFNKHLWSFKKHPWAEVIVRKAQTPVQDRLAAKARKYYFKVPMKLLRDETGHSKHIIHENMKIKFSSYEDEKTGLLVIESVFSNESTLTVDQKWDFIKDVRDWASDFFNMYIPEPEKVDVE